MESERDLSDDREGSSQMEGESDPLSDDGYENDDPCGENAHNYNNGVGAQRRKQKKSAEKDQ